MQIEEQDIRKIRRLLIEQRKAGYQWIAYDTFKPACTNDVYFNTFKDIDSAYQYCEEKNYSAGYGESNWDYAFKPIINVLQSLTVTKKADKPIDSTILQEQLSRHLVQPYKYCDNLATLLADGQYHSIKHQQEIPVKDFDRFIIIEHKYPDSEIYEQGHSSLSHPSVTSFAAAQQLFDQIVQNYTGRSFQPELKILGTIKGQELSLNLEDFPHSGTGILFTVANADRPQGSYISKQFNDPFQPTSVLQHKMAKFNRLTSTLEFFDGHLQKVAPSAKVAYMNFNHFSSAPLQVISNRSLIQNASLSKDANLHNSTRAGMRCGRR